MRMIEGAVFLFLYKVQYFYEGAVFQIVLRAIQTVPVSHKMSGLKFTLLDVTSFLLDDLSGVKEIIFRPVDESLLAVIKLN